MEKDLIDVALKRDSNLLLSDMLESIRTIQEYVVPITNAWLKTDRKAMDSVCKQIENIREAAGRIPNGLVSTGGKLRICVTI